MKYSNSLRPFLAPLIITGLFPFQIKVNHGRILCASKPKLQIILVIMYLISFILSEAYICYEKVLRNPVVNELVFVFCTSVIFLVYGVLCITNMVCRKKMKMLFWEVRRIEEKVQEFDIGNRQDTNIFNIIINIQLVYLITVLIYLFLIYLYNYDLKHSVLFTVGFTLPKMVIVGHSFLYVDWFFFIYQHYSAFNDELERNTLKKVEIGKLLKLHNNFNALTKKLNRYYDCQNIFVVFIYIVWISYELYHLVLLVIQEKIAGFDKTLVLFATSWILVLFSALLVMIIMYTMTLCQRKRFIPLLIHYCIKNRITHEIKDFLKRFLYEKTFPEESLFPLDFNLLFSIMGTFATFLAFLTQVSTDL